MSKYIVKNCPARCNGMFKDCIGTSHNECKDCTDCIVKQVIDKCRGKVINDVCINCCDFETKANCWQCDNECHRDDIYYRRANVCFADEILQLFEIADFTESETRLSEGNVNGRTKSGVKDLPERE